jgi:hypothetical protein
MQRESSKLSVLTQDNGGIVSHYETRGISTPGHVFANYQPCKAYTALHNNALRYSLYPVAWRLSTCCLTGPSITIDA